MATLTVEIPDQLLSQLQQTGQPLQDIILRAVEAYVVANRSVPITQTQTWKLCGTLQVNSPEAKYVIDQNQDQLTTNYAEHIDDILY